MTTLSYMIGEEVPIMECCAANSGVTFCQVPCLFASLLPMEFPGGQDSRGATAESSDA